MKKTQVLGEVMELHPFCKTCHYFFFLAQIEHLIAREPKVQPTPCEPMQLEWKSKNNAHQDSQFHEFKFILSLLVYENCCKGWYIYI